MIGIKVAVRITKDDGRPLAHILDFGSKRVLIDSRKVGSYFETMAVESSRRKDEEWNWRNPVYEKHFYSESDMIQGHIDAVNNIAEQDILR